MSFFGQFVPLNQVIFMSGPITSNGSFIFSRFDQILIHRSGFEMMTFWVELFMEQLIWRQRRLLVGINFIFIIINVCQICGVKGVNGKRLARTQLEFFDATLYKAVVNLFYYFYFISFIFYFFFLILISFNLFTPRVYPETATILFVRFKLCFDFDQHWTWH